MSKRTYFILNGESYYSNQSIYISDLVNYFNYKESLLVLELNHSIYNKKSWDQTILNNNDIIEIVSIVGGG